MTRLRSQRPRLSPRARVWLSIFLAGFLGYLLAVSIGVVNRPPLVVGQDAAVQGAEARTTLQASPSRFVDIQPVGGQYDTLLVFYSGGLVRPQAYEWLGTALAGRGVRTVIPVFPLDLAVTGIGRADALIKEFGAGKRVILAGHSLGGAMAAQYAHDHRPQLAGLILMGAYPAGNVSLRDLPGAPLPVLSLLAEHDEVATAKDVRDGLTRLPTSARLTVIKGANHAFFGRYGPQKGDGIPTVTRAEAETQIVADTEEFLGGIEVK
ncbi:alpha/beta hydrolase [Deinococcus sp. Arct2-2]|uniref:alpha/beta family hydrolase n=1 Tax=Deinococcus sp. Arct2-2 TaxID=2568653 RepID=UPI0010A3C9B5|nr:alpha/beta family hydrolase [Deinococcus sp. Arct2-2]THF70592.1 alpha/beta hydrolase [Deinococcus sp. Arct2-2]